MPTPDSETSIAATQFDTDKRNYHGSLDLSNCVLGARTHYGKGYIAQMLDLWALSREVGRLTPHDSYYYRLYAPEKYTRDAMRRFLSERIHWDLLRKCSDERWWAAADDKLVA